MPEIQPNRKRSPLTSGPQLESSLLSQGTLGKRETLLVLPWGGRGGAAGLQRVGTWELLTILRCPGRSLTAKNYPAQNVSSAEVKTLV